MNRIDETKYDISTLPLFKNSDSAIFNSNIKILASLIDYTEENFNEQAALDQYYTLKFLLSSEQEQKQAKLLSIVIAPKVLTDVIRKMITVRNNYHRKTLDGTMTNSF